MSKNNSDFFICKNSWSEIKDDLLKKYLKPYFQKVLMTNRPIFYVDCFAGKGKFEDGKDGSPLIALKVRDNSFKQTKVKNNRIDTCFIDVNYASDLKENTSTFFQANGKILIISGKFEEVIQELLLNKQESNVFIYIDPYGIRSLDAELIYSFGQGQFYSIELLINMNSFGFFREACRVMKVEYQGDEAFNNIEDIVEYAPTQFSVSNHSEKILSEIAGGDYWKEIVLDYQKKQFDGYEAEKRFSSQYKERLKQKYTYVLDMPIRLKEGQRPKYRMIHVSNHEDGCILMADNMTKRSNELYLEIQQKGQLSLFDYDVENRAIDEEDILEKIKSYLNKHRLGVGVKKFIAGFFTEYGVICSSSIITETLKKMEKNGMISVVRIPEFTKNKIPKRTFTESKNQRVTIRRI